MTSSSDPLERLSQEGRILWRLLLALVFLLIVGSLALLILRSHLAGVEELVLIGGYIWTARSLSHYYQVCGVPTWKAWVPLYNLYTGLMLAGLPAWLLLAVVASPIALAYQRLAPVGNLLSWLLTLYWLIAIWRFFPPSWWLGRSHSAHLSSAHGGISTPHQFIRPHSH